MKRTRTRLLGRPSAAALAVGGILGPVSVVPAEPSPRTAGLRGPEKEHPAAWSAHGKLVRLSRQRAAASPSRLSPRLSGTRRNPSLSPSGVTDRRSRPSWRPASPRVLEAGRALRVPQDDVDRAKPPLFFQHVASPEAEAVSRFPYEARRLHPAPARPDPRPGTLR
ncbi:hypothetical protein [Streptomyces sp. WG7]|uniref:hypothetical protein n=1 Tax=Streptomyces sp. WG7 TaxID=3417650 RepID=UPI003CF03F7E